MRRLWRWYQQCLPSYPLRTQVVISGILWGLGDIGAQAVTHYSARSHHHAKNPEDKDKEFKIDWKRVGITGSFGCAYVGPVHNYCKLPYDLYSFLSPGYLYLDDFIWRRYRPFSFKFVASKFAAGSFVFGPVDLLLFFSYVGLASGRSVEQVKDDVKRDFIPALVLGGLPGLVLGGTIWSAMQMASFRRIPVTYVLLYASLGCLLDGCFLSWIEQQGDASWKQWFTSFQKIEDQKSKV